MVEASPIGCLAACGRVGTEPWAEAAWPGGCDPGSPVLDLQAASALK